MTGSPRRLVALTAVLAAVFALSDWAEGGPVFDHPVRDLALWALNTLPLLFLGRNPLVVGLLFSVAYPLWIIVGHPGHLLQSLPTVAAMYAVGAWARPIWLRAIALVLPAWMLGASAVGWWDAPTLEIGYVAVVFVVVWVLGVAMASRRSYAEQLEAKTIALESARRELADRAVADERSRIARELHDIIAHAMSVITVRAGVGAHLINSRPAEAAAALEVIENTGREALSEMRRMLAVLRDPDPRAPRSGPQPGLTDLPALVAQVREGGVVVTLTTEGPARQLTGGLDLAAYRVVQEALTNVVKHAPASRAFVTVRYLPEELEVEVRNAGARPVGAIVEGQGMRGMAERVALYDGRLEIGPEPDGFKVAAQFPLEVGS